MLPACFPLRCTVRNCHQDLTQHAQSLVCDSKHSFDRSKFGYWTLLQPQDRKSKNAGDSKETVDARRKWLSFGYTKGLEQILVDIVEGMSIGTALDIGAGDGHFGKRLFAKRSVQFCGIDLSKHAMRLASGLWKEAVWVVANADRGLPVKSGSCDFVMSLFGRKPISEIARVLKNDGFALVAVPGHNDLIELREQIQSTKHQKSRIDKVVSECIANRLQLAERFEWDEKVLAPAMHQYTALAMTYRGQRSSQQIMISEFVERRISLAAEIMLFQKIT